MQNALREVNPSSKKLAQRDSGNLIACQDLTERLKPFVALKLLSSSADAKLGQDSLSRASGQAIITYVVSGQAAYSDSTGKRGLLTQDSWSWVITGSGAWSTLEPITSDYLAVQLSIALTPVLENSLPQSVYLDSNLMERYGPAQVLIGWHGEDRGQFALPSLMNYLVVHLGAGQDWVYALPTNHHLAWVLVVSGSMETATGEIVNNKITLLDRTIEEIRLRASADSVFVVGSSQAFMHELISHKNSVHTSTEALQLGLERLAELEAS